MQEAVQNEELKLEFKLWCITCLARENVSKSELAKRIGAPLSRISETINGTGQCKKYIPLIIREIGSEEELKKYEELYI